ncbi:hypothetical protein ATK36_5988 [Amycolatopsis sulphurea]|uniref:Uncharacterized protein n=1 Tax=Amycolatopsis sulphurea TaxID=76022 RepID=A0A2A9FJ25_9PSEU|nr:hypothetical protein [Amycolatopsis sulphurea]PFG50741.1 hypothetical protein ATK36_5988 [Amycolatopsis sulphurea]
MVVEVRGKLERGEDVAVAAAVGRTAKRYRQFVRDLLGVKYESKKVREADHSRPGVRGAAVVTAASAGFRVDEPGGRAGAVGGQLARHREVGTQSALPGGGLLALTVAGRQLGG